MNSSEIEEIAVKRFKRASPTSRKLFQETSRTIAGGITGDVKFFRPYPLFMKSANGSKLWDVDGNEYVDYLSAFGAIILGHGNPAVRDALDYVKLNVGTTLFGTPGEFESEFADLLLNKLGFDGLVRFTNSGAEATALAIRLAKAYTGRRGIAKFEGHYHGSNDRLLVSYHPDTSKSGEKSRPVPVPDSYDVDSTILNDTVVLPFNDIESTREILNERRENLSCVIMEPLEEGVIRADDGFINGVRKLTQEMDIPLIFDEVKTGFRVSMSGAAGYYSVKPDIICLGKTIGGGLPIGAVVGKREITDILGQNAGKKRLFSSGTFSGNPLSMIAGIKTIDMLSRDRNFDSIVDKANDLKRQIDQELDRYGIEHSVQGAGTIFSYFLSDSEIRCYRDIVCSNMALRNSIDLLMISEGIYIKPLGRFSMMLSHSEEDIESAVAALSRSLKLIT